MVRSFFVSLQTEALTKNYAIMKKAIITLLCIIGCLQMNAQRVYNEEGKYYEMGIVVYKIGSQYAPSSVYLILASLCKGNNYSEHIYRDENGKEIIFNNFPACVTYFICRGWEVLDINLGERFIIRKEITKEQAEKLANDCIKERK